MEASIERSEHHLGQKAYISISPLRNVLFVLSHQITRVISSPSRSTTGFFTAIFFALSAVVVLAKLRVCAVIGTDILEGRMPARPVTRIMLPVPRTWAIFSRSLAGRRVCREFLLRPSGSVRNTNGRDSFNPLGCTVSEIMEQRSNVADSLMPVG